MDVTNQATVMQKLLSRLSGHESSAGIRVELILALALAVHLSVKGVRHFSEWMVHRSRMRQSPLAFVTHQPKFLTIIQLIASCTTFIIYFFAMGLFLQELGVNLYNYLASASIVALAISFGSQGLVQDVVIGLTLIFSDAMDVGDLVELFGSTTVIGHVEKIGMRFTTLRNFFNQVVFIPNRTIANVSRFPYGGVYAYADIQMPEGVEPDKATTAICTVTQGMWAQFGAIILSEPEIGTVEKAEGGGWHYLRVQFKIWPGQGNLIETTFRQQVVSALRMLQPNFAEWQVPVTYRAMTAAGEARC